MAGIATDSPNPNPDSFPRTPASEQSIRLPKPIMPGRAQASPSRASPRKLSAQQAAAKTLPTPVSMSPNAGSTSSFLTSTTRLPPSFEQQSHHSHHSHQSSSWSSRYPQSTLYSPYRPGEYGRGDHYGKSERGLAKIERKLFDDDQVMESQEKVDESELQVQSQGGRKDTNSSPLAPAFEAKMVLRSGASVDLISWLRTNFHHIPESQHNSMTPTMSLIGIRALLLERFPRVPDLTELSKAVIAAFPKSRWETSHGAFSSDEPPNLRGLIWHGQDVAEEEEEEDEEEYVPKLRPQPQIVTRARGKTTHHPLQDQGSGSRSPPQSTLVSPISSSARKPPPATPARSVLEEFAEIATLADKTPRSKTRSLPGDTEIQPPSGALALSELCNGPLPAHQQGSIPNLKRRASQSPELLRRRSTTPDKLSGLLAAAEAVEGSPITSVLGHKRRRTIGGPAPMASDVFQFPRPRHHHQSRGTVSPAIGLSSYRIDEDAMTSRDILVPLNDTASAVSLTDLDTVSLQASSRPRDSKAPTSSNASQSSNISNMIPPKPSSRKPNELPTDGDNPGVDCKPPHPYHEMIRYAVERAPDQRLQLSQIYSSIADRFPFFKTLDEKKTAGWQNSIRHNLSLKKMFVRVNKVDNEPDESGGKGGWWTVRPGIPDEGRPGRKAKSKKRTSNENAESLNGDEAESTKGSEMQTREGSMISVKSGKMGFSLPKAQEPEEITQ